MYEYANAWKIISNTVLIVFFICIDQFSKYLIRTSGGFYICNPGIAFGIKIPIVYLFLFLVLFLGFYFLTSNFQTLMSNKFPRTETKNFGVNIWNFVGNFDFGIRFFAILIISGALSNILDRFLFGCVIDFIDLRFWPVFNFADVFITIGAIMILFRTYVFNKKLRD